jgi:hypothetical protein
MLTQLLALWHPQRRLALGLVAMLLLTTALNIAPSAAAPPEPAALRGSVHWDDQPSVISNGADTAYPWSATDSNDVTHVIYMTTDGAIWYTNNAGGSFNIGGKRLDLAGSTPPAWPFAAIAVGPNNVVHVVYQLFNKSNQIYYRRSDDGGQTWSSREQVSNDPKTASPDLAVDSNNDAHIVWMGNRCGQYNVYYRLRRNSGGMSGTSAPRDSCSTYENRPQIAVIGTQPHVIFQNNSEIYYRRLDGDGQWRGDNISVSPKYNSANASIASDGISKLFVAWDEGVNGHDIEFRTSFDGGHSWSNIVSFSNGPQLATSPYVSWSDAAKRAFVVWQDGAGSGDSRGEIWEREFDPQTLDTTFADQISHFNGRSLWPTIGTGSKRADIVWMDEANKSSGFFQVWNWGGALIDATPITGCNGTLKLDGVTIDGVKATDTMTLTGTITPEAGCVPDKMQVSLNEPITDATPMLTYSPNLPPLLADEGLCAQTVYVRLFRSGAGAQAFSDSITVDTSVDAIVHVSNPHLLSLPAFPDTPKPGASDGDPNYTREPKFFLGINDAGDCTGLTTFNIPSVGSGAITDGSYTNWLDLPNVTTAGSKPFIVNVNDKIGHTTPFPQSIVYDPNPPVLDSTANPTATSLLSTTSILVPLAFDKIHVTDDQYGPREGLPADAEFWGVEMANSTTVVTPDNPGLKWFPVQVPNASNTFTVTWDLLSGLSSPPAQNTGGDVYTYARFIDGAGNVSTGAIVVRRIRLEPNYTLPTQYLPIVRK